MVADIGAAHGSTITPPASSSSARDGRALRVVPSSVPRPRDGSIATASAARRPALRADFVS
jgi:hypothetical protein